MRVLALRLHAAMCACQHMAYLLQNACVHECCVCLQLWGTIDHVEAPGPSELVLFEASSTAQQAAGADQLTQMGQQVGHTRKEQRWFCCRGWQGGGTGAAGHKARSEEARNVFVHWEAARDIRRHVGSQWHAADTWHATDVWHATASQQPSTACNSSRQANAHGPAGRAHQEGAKGHKGSLLHANRYLACNRCLACDSGPAAKHSKPFLGPAGTAQQP